MEAMQVTITLTARETELLRKEAMRELRRPKDQAHILLRKALGLTEEQSSKSTRPTKATQPVTA